MRFRLGAVLGGGVVGPGVPEMVGGAVGDVELVEVDHVGLQPLWRAYDGLRHRRARGRRPAADGALAGAGELGGQHDGIAAAGFCDPVAEELLRAPRGFGADRIDRIHLSAVEEIDAGVQRPVDLLMGVGFGGLAAPDHYAEAEFGDCQTGAAEWDHLHQGPRFAVGREPSAVSGRGKGRSLAGLRT